MRTDGAGDGASGVVEALHGGRGDERAAEDVPTRIVAVGASAGGLEAIESLFLRMPADTGLGFVVIQHLSPDYKSLMVELLSKKTTMTVHRAEDGMRVRANEIYLIPPKKNLTIFHGKLLLTEQDPHRGINLPIDVFLRSLAEDQAERAVAIILSGTGSDGMRGVRTIKECGGMVMVQDEESAKFDGMPRAAISTGLADFILTPANMPAQLAAFLKHPYVAKPERAAAVLTDEESLSHLFALLREQCKVDFTHYKPSTVSRRIERRMTVHQIDDIQKYVAFLRGSPTEVGTLFRELLIGVTSFFRDPEVFERLAAHLEPEAFARAGQDDVRFWVAGCSTGEEAYSLAMMAREWMEAQGVAREVKIFATDIDRDALHYAATGTYPESIAADIAPRLLSKYFIKKHESFQVTRTLREMVVFAPHNIIRDPPFTNISLVSCRNLLIYFQPVLQRRVLEAFNFSLRASGVLLLGTSESTGETSDLWETLESRLKIYRSRGRQARIGEGALLAHADASYGASKGRFGGVRRVPRAVDEERLLERFVEGAADDLLPLSIVVNAQQEVLHVVGQADGFLTLPSGRLVNDIAQLAVKDLSVPLTTGIQKVFRQQKELRFSNVRVRQKGETRLVDVRIKPLPDRKGQEPLLAVLIAAARAPIVEKAPPDVLTFDLSREAEAHLKEVEQELQFTRENLQATIEELETSNEELQATNEELLASNEELQSTNEELQSTNEELFTVNAESQSKIIELTELHNDVDNLLASSQIGTLILDENTEVRRFSPQVATIFHLMDTDIGRPLGHLTSSLVDVDVLGLIAEVRASSHSVEREVRSQDGRWHLMRVLPYRVGPRVYSGSVVTFVDITRIKNAELSARESEARYRALLAEMTTGFAIHETIADAAGAITDYRVVDLNDAYARLFAMRREQLVGRPMCDLFPETDHRAWIERYARVAASGEPAEFVDFDSDLKRMVHVKAFRVEPTRFAVLVQPACRDRACDWQPSEELVRR